MSWMQIILSGVIGLGCFSTPLVTALAYGMALNNYIVLAVSGTVILSSSSLFSEDGNPIESTYVQLLDLFW